MSPPHSSVILRISTSLILPSVLPRYAYWMPWCLTFTMAISAWKPVTVTHACSTLHNERMWVKAIPLGDNSCRHLSYALCSPHPRHPPASHNSAKIAKWQLNTSKTQFLSGSCFLFLKALKVFWAPFNFPLLPSSFFPLPQFCSPKHLQKLIMASQKAICFQNFSPRWALLDSKTIKLTKTHLPWPWLFSLVFANVRFETESMFHLPVQQGVYIY